MPSIDSLLEELKPVFTQSFEVEYRDEAEFSAQMSLRSSKNEGKIKTVDYLVEEYCKERLLPNNFLLGEIKLVATEKYGNEDGDELKKFGKIGFSVPTKISNKNNTIDYVSAKNCRKVKLLIEVLLAEFKSAVTEKEDVENGDEE